MLEMGWSLGTQWWPDCGRHGYCHPSLGNRIPGLQLGMWLSRQGWHFQPSMCGHMSSLWPVGYECKWPGSPIRTFHCCIFRSIHLNLLFLCCPQSWSQFAFHVDPVPLLHESLLWLTTETKYFPKRRILTGETPGNETKELLILWKAWTLGGQTWSV